MFALCLALSCFIAGFCVGSFCAATFKASGVSRRGVGFSVRELNQYSLKQWQGQVRSGDASLPMEAQGNLHAACVDVLTTRPTGAFLLRVERETNGKDGRTTQHFIAVICLGAEGVRVRDPLYADELGPDALRIGGLLQIRSVSKVHRVTVWDGSSLLRHHK